MKIRHAGESETKVELQMTPMIDIVFQLLVFFILTFKVVSVEGDFNIKMPRISQGAAPSDSPLPPLRVRLLTPSDPNAPVCGIRVGDRALASFEELRNEVVQQIAQRGPEAAKELEVELDPDYDLPYRFTIDAITAISGYIDPGTGQVVPLARNIRFAPPRKPAQGQ